MTVPVLWLVAVLALAAAALSPALQPARAQSSVRPAVPPPAAAIPAPVPAPTAPLPRPGTPASAAVTQGQLEGLWVGQGYQSYETNESSWSIALTVEENTYKIDYPSLGCGGTWKVRSRSAQEIVFTEAITYGRTRCIDGGTVKLGLVSRNALSFNYEADLNGPVRATGTLTRPAAAQSPSLPPVDAVEIGYWESVRGTGNAEDLKSYLRSYPNGRYVNLARLWLERLAPADTKPVSMVDFGAYHALVIGNNRYRFLPRLETAINDAHAVAGLLAGQYGFRVKLLQDATRADIMRALFEYRRTLGSSDNLLIYYAGHGALDSAADQGYWQPVDADEAEPTNWIANGDLTTAIKAMNAKHVLIVADSCYSGTLTRAGIALGPPRQGNDDRIEWLKRTAQKRARTVLTSGGMEPVQDGGGAGHSVFAKMLLGALAENTDVVDAQSLSVALKRLVTVNSPQTPEYADIRQAGHEGGDFLFVRKGK